MKQSVTFTDFLDAFRAHGREDQFSYSGLRVLFNSLEEYEESTGEEIELDVISLCCDYCEYDADETIDNYSIDVSDCEDEDEKLEDAPSETNGTAILRIVLSFDSFFFTLRSFDYKF